MALTCPWISGRPSEAVALHAITMPSIMSGMGQQERDASGGSPQLQFVHKDGGDSKLAGRGEFC